MIEMYQTTEVTVPNLVERFTRRETSLMMMPRAWRLAGSGTMN
jgi:hypothetical protein